MNIADVQKDLDEIREAGEDCDHERAHSLEDALHCAVLKAIADGTCEDPAACARLALTSEDFNFSRWCA